MLFENANQIQRVKNSNALNYEKQTIYNDHPVFSDHHFFRK